MAPPRKKAKLSNGTSSGAPDREPSDSEHSGDTATTDPPNQPQAVPTVDKSNWQGFCTIESEPAILNFILNEWGLKNVRAKEIATMDDISNEPLPIYGIVFCSKYKGSDGHQQESCPDNVWFANQVSRNSCLSVAVMNILNNAVELDLGSKLQTFKSETMGLTPFERGVRLANFEHVRRAHNCFATEMDILNTDLMLKEEYETAQKAKEKAAKVALTANATPKPSTKKRKANSKASKKKKGEEENSEEAHNADASFHYQAFLPVGKDVWMLDGMDRQPTKMMTFNASIGWILSFLPRFRQILEKGIADKINIMYLCKNPATEPRAKLAANIASISAIDQRLDVLNPQWRASLTDEATLDGPSEEFGIDADAIASVSIDPKLQTQITDYAFSDLFDIRNSSVARKQGPLRNPMREIAAREAAELRTAQAAMIDFGPFIRRWLLELGNVSRLRPFIEQVKHEQAVAAAPAKIPKAGAAKTAKAAKPEAKKAMKAAKAKATKALKAAEAAKAAKPSQPAEEEEEDL